MTTDPLSGPFMSRKDLTDYSDMPGYAIPVERAGEEGES